MAGASIGVPPEAFDFYQRLTLDNTKSFWQANKAVYLQSVKAPVEALCEALSAYGPFHLFRPYNDARFAKNRPPYKTHQGAYGESEAGAGYYFHVGADEVLVGAGYYAMATDQLTRFRTAVDDDARGNDLVTRIDFGASNGLSAAALDELKTAPRGFAKDHPRIEILRRKGLIMSRSFPVESWMSSGALQTAIRSVFEHATPVCAWLDSHVGPSTQAPEDAQRW